MNSLYSPYSILRVGPLPIHVFTDGFGSIEENIFNSIYFTDEEIREADTIIDLGAHHGSFTIKSVVKSSPNSTIIAIEPNLHAVKLLYNNLRALKWLIVMKRLSIKVLNRAIWESEGIVDFELSWWSEGHHVSFKPRGSGVKVRAITLNDIIRFAKGKTIVKMDIEGAEYRVLKSADLRCVHMIAVEAHGDPNVIARILKRRGFETSIQHHEIKKDLSVAWLKIKPRGYGFLVATYRLMTSQMVKPTMIIVKGIRA